MDAFSSFRWRSFAALFAVLCLLCAVTLAAFTIAAARHWNPIAPVLIALLFVCVASLLLLRHMARQCNQLTGAIRSGSLQQARTMRTALRGTFLEQAASEWETALHTLQDSYLDKESEATRHYATLIELMGMIAKATDERASYLRGHSERVASYSAAISRELGLDATQVERVRLSALLHDIGIIALDDAIVKKDSPLTPDEFEAIKAHTVKGASILRPIEALNDLIPGVELHHESLDGKGYPYGLRGEEIPKMARIIAVAESFDAMTTPRPYQTAMDPEYVLEVLHRLAGIRYDGDAVTALTALVRRGTISVTNLRAPVSFPRQRKFSGIV